MSTEIPAGRNYVSLLGEVEETIDVKDVKGGKVATFTLAVREEWTSKDGKVSESLAHVPCTLFGEKRAGILAQYVSAGDMLYVQGSIRISEHGTEVSVREFEFIKSGRGERTERDDGRGGSRSNPRTRDEPSF